jgi:hypothetical protein
VKPQAKNNLVSALVNSDTKAKATIIKEVSDPFPITLEDTSASKKLNRKILDLMPANPAPKKRD